MRLLRRPARQPVPDAPYAAHLALAVVRDERDAAAGHLREPERERPELGGEVLVDEQDVHGS